MPIFHYSHGSEEDMTTNCQQHRRGSWQNHANIDTHVAIVIKRLRIMIPFIKAV